MLWFALISFVVLFNIVWWWTYNDNYRKEWLNLQCKVDSSYTDGGSRDDKYVLYFSDFLYPHGTMSVPEGRPMKFSCGLPYGVRGNNVKCSMERPDGSVRDAYMHLEPYRSSVSTLTVFVHNTFGPGSYDGKCKRRE